MAEPSDTPEVIVAAALGDIPLGTTVYTSAQIDSIGEILKQYVDQKMTSVMKYCGSVNTKAELDLIEVKNVGDFYNVLDTGDNYAWDGENWDQVGGFFTLPDYLSNANLEAKYVQKNDTDYLKLAKITVYNSSYTITGGTADQIVFDATTGRLALATNFLNTVNNKLSTEDFNTWKTTAFTPLAQAVGDASSGLTKKVADNETAISSLKTKMISLGESIDGHLQGDDPEEWTPIDLANAMKAFRDMLKSIES